MKNYLGIFDSGIGGISVLKRVLERHGEHPCLYLADTARVPFGNKDPSEIRLIASELIHWLKEENVSIVLVACNTTNSLALDLVKRISDVPVLDLISSTAMLINESRVGVLATPATAASGSYGSAIKSMKPGTFVIEQGCPAFVELIEAGELESEEIKSSAKEYLSPLLSAKVESIVLGCSHYPFLEPVLRQLLPSNVRLVDPAIGLASCLDNLLGEKKIMPQTPITFANTSFCTTSSPECFSSKLRPLIGISPQVDMVSLRSKACFF